MTSWVVLSSASPKNAFQSPAASQRGERRPDGTAKRVSTNYHV